MITESISKVAVQILESTGYAGAAFLMALESMIAPVPSEAVMPFVGFMVADGKWNLGWSLFATTAGSLAGSLFSYWLGHIGGKPVVLKVGKYLLLNQHDLDITERFFQRRSAIIALFAGRFIPVIRHFISIPAGMGGMRLGPFILATVTGAAIWNGFLLFLGWKLRDHWGSVQKYSHLIDIVVLVLIVAGAAWFIATRWKHRPPPPSQN